MTDTLCSKWRAEAALFRARGVTWLADAAESYAAELEAYVRERELEALTLEDATRESGYSYSSLQKKLASGELENVGSKHSPRVRRGHLPRKGGRPAAEGIAERALLARIA